MKLFYATSGGQLHDTGAINGKKVVNIVKQGTVVLHELGETLRLRMEKLLSAVLIGTEDCN